MRRGGPALGPVDLVVRPVHAEQGPVVHVPDAADDVDGLAQRLDGLPWGEPPPAHGLDRVPEGARAEPQLEPASAEQVEAGRGPGEHGRRAEREVDDVARQADALGPRGGVRQQRPGVEEGRLVGVVLEGGQVQARGLRLLYERDDLLGRGVRGGDEGSEHELVAVVRHVPSPCALRQGRCVVTKNI